MVWVIKYGQELYLFDVTINLSPKWNKLNEMIATSCESAAAAATAEEQREMSGSPATSHKLNVILCETLRFASGSGSVINSMRMA